MIVIIFYKVTYNTKQTFNSILTKFFDSFYIRILAFLFARIYYDIMKF